jgi:hypothetical protein
VPDSGAGRQLSGFREFMRRNSLQPNYLNTRLYAYAATELLLEGIKRAGKRVTRMKLLDEIEKLYAFDVGLNRPLTFGSRHRVGLRGAYIVRFDAGKRRLVATDTWVRLD